MAEAVGRSERTLRRWEAADPDAKARVGRPPAAQEEFDEVRALVRAELERQGWQAGEGPIHRALKGQVSLWRVRQVLAPLKRERAAQQRALQVELRQSVEVMARDTVWAIDATHLGCDPIGRAVEAEVLREVASTRTLALSVGPKATATEVLALLMSAVRVRDGPPLVLVSDNASTYVCSLIDAWCAEHGVVHLKNQPRTPQHNAAAEHGIGELKRDAEVARWDTAAPSTAALDRLVETVHCLDHRRLRQSRGWRTAARADAEAPHWSMRVRRARFLQAAYCAIRQAVLDSPSKRARRRAERNAILHTLEQFKLIRWNRGTGLAKGQ